MDGQWMGSSMRLLSDQEVFGEAPPASEPDFLSSTYDDEVGIDVTETIGSVSSAQNVDEAIDMAETSVERGGQQLLTDDEVFTAPDLLSDREVFGPQTHLLSDEDVFGKEPQLLSDEDVGIRLSDDTVAQLHKQGKVVAEAQPYDGFWDRAKQTFKEHVSLDSNVMKILYRKLLGGKLVDPATGKALSEDDIRHQKNSELEKDQYLLAGQESAEGILEHAGDFVGVIAKEASSPSAIMTAPIGGTATGLARVGKMAASGGVYEGVAGTAEQIAEEGEITDPKEIAIRSATGAVAAPVFDAAIRATGKGLSKTHEKLSERLKKRRQESTATETLNKFEREGIDDPTVIDTDALDDLPEAAMEHSVTYGEELQRAIQPLDEKLKLPDESTPSISNKKIDVERTSIEEPELPNEIANAWMPGGNHVGMIDDAVLPAAKKTTAKAKQKPIRREDVIAPFLKALDLPLYEGRVKGKNKLGFYLPKKETVRIKNKNDLEVAAHEIAHAIDDRVPEIRQSWMKGEKAKIYREELKGVSYDKGKIYEGFAEFVRLYTTQNAKAKELAPHYYQWFKGFTAKHEYGPAIETARKGMTAWFEQGALQRAASKIGKGRNVNEALYAPLRSFRQAVSDDLDGIYKMERELTGGIKSVGAYETARLTRASHSITEGVMTMGRPVKREDGSFAFEGKGLEQILKSVSDDLDNWTLYAVGRSAHELRIQGREKLFTPTEIRAMRDLETPTFKKAFNEYQAWNKAVVDFAEQQGLINPDTRKLWRRAQYLPFHRVDSGQTAGTSTSAPEGTFGGIHRLTGGTGNIRDVTGNMIQNAARLMTEALRNEARVQVADMADKIRGGGRFMVKIPRISKTVRVHRDEIKRIVQDAGITDEMVKALNEANGFAMEDYSKLADFVTLFQHGQSPGGKNIVAVYRNGKPDYYEVIDPVLMRAISALDRPVKNWLVRFLSGFRRLGQSSITISLDFMAANIARDTLMGSIMSRHGFKPFIDSIRGMKSRITKDATYREFIANGGGFSSYLVDERAFKKHLESFYTKKGIDPKYVLDAPGKLLYFMESLTDAFEMSTRLGEFKQAKQGGAHPRHAAYSAREVSTDFAMRGDSEVLGFMYDTVMFLKAGVNGIDRSYRGFAHDPNKQSIAVKTGILAMMSMGLYAYNRKFDEYNDMEDWKKDSYWHFFVPKDDGSHHHFMYPKIWEIGAVSSVAERTLEHMFDGDMKQYVVDFSRVVMNQFKFDYVPQALAPLYEQFLNKIRFTGRPIETQGMERLAPFARSGTYTSETLKELGFASLDLPRQLQFPPARAEALLRGYFNTWAMYGLTLSDAMMFDNKPKMRVDQYPVFRRFYSADPAKHSKHETMFYDMLKETTELRNTMRQMDRQYRPNIADELEQRPEVNDYSELQDINEELQLIRQDQREIRMSELSPKEKRKQIDALIEERNELLKLAVEGMKTNENINEE
jgi:conjugative element/phage-associated large polyvalent protein